MVFLEKLSFFNIEHFRKLYNTSEDAYNSDKNFFEIYDDESFIIKYIIRKQIKLFKVKDEYVGYIWYEYPAKRGFSNIYDIYLKDEYLDLISTRILSFFNFSAFKFDMLSNSRASYIMKKLNFNINSNHILMKLNTTNQEKYFSHDKCIFRHFKEGQDEELRCSIQNSVFNEKNRIPLTVEDIYREEDEEYYLSNYGVFIYNNNGQAVGYGQVILNNGLYTIVNIGILDKYRKQGYGEMLVRYLIDLCYKNSIKNVYIRVEKNNLKALYLYNKIGFREYKSFVSWYKDLQ